MLWGIKEESSLIFMGLLFFLISLKFFLHDFEMWPLLHVILPYMIESASGCMILFSCVCEYHISMSVWCMCVCIYMYMQNMYSVLNMHLVCFSCLLHRDANLVHFLRYLRLSVFVYCFGFYSSWVGFSLLFGHEWNIIVRDPDLASVVVLRGWLQQSGSVRKIAPHGRYWKS